MSVLLLTGLFWSPRVGSSSVLIQETSPVIVTKFNLTYSEYNEDVYLDVMYEYDFQDEERLTDATLYLSLDNDTYIIAQHHQFDPELMNASGEMGYWFANSIGDPLPFDIEEGQLLYGYVEFITTEDTYLSDVFVQTVPATVRRPWIFNIPSPIFLVGGIVLSFLPLAIVLYLCLNRRSKGS